MSLLVAPALAANVSLDISIKTKNPDGTLSKTVLMSEDGTAEFSKDDISVSVRAIPVKDLDIPGDFAFEMDVRENGQLISQPIFYVSWNKKAYILLSETNKYGNTHDTLSITVVASQEK